MSFDSKTLSSCLLFHLFYIESTYLFKAIMSFFSNVNPKYDMIFTKAESA